MVNCDQSVDHSRTHHQRLIRPDMDRVILGAHIDRSLQHDVCLVAGLVKMRARHTGTTFRPPTRHGAVAPSHALRKGGPTVETQPVVVGLGAERRGRSSHNTELVAGRVGQALAVCATGWDTLSSE